MPAIGTTEPRGKITERAPLQEGYGTSRRWTRVIRGIRYSFTAVLMPSGERRYAVTRLRPGGDPRFAREWKSVAFWTVRAPAVAPDLEVTDIGPAPMTGDDLITAVVQAPTPDDAARIVREASGHAVLAAADLLYIDPTGHSVPWLRQQIVREARS